MALAHAIKVKAAYRRGDLMVKRQKLVAAWAAYIDGGKTRTVVLFARVGAGMTALVVKQPLG